MIKAPKGFVEDQANLNVNGFKKAGVLDSSILVSGDISIKLGLLDFGKWQFQIYTQSPTQKTLVIESLPGEQRSPFRLYRVIDLVGRSAPFGGIRWWFLCPLPKKTDDKSSQSCNRVCSFLYYDPQRNIFGCRECLELTYACSYEKKHPVIQKMRGMNRLFDLQNKLAKSRNPLRKKLLEQKIYEIDSSLQDSFNTDLFSVRKKKLEVNKIQ